jgi:hypothetical protein
VHAFARPINARLSYSVTEYAAPKRARRDPIDLYWRISWTVFASAGWRLLVSTSIFHVTEF